MLLYLCTAASASVPLAHPTANAGCRRFDTAVEEAQRALLAAKVEASSAYRGIGLVKLMGRQSGFIAMQASMASGVVDVVSTPPLVPVLPWALPCPASSTLAAMQCVASVVLHPSAYLAAQSHA